MGSGPDRGDTSDLVDRWFPTRVFEPRHTPTWLATACLLAGQRAPDLAGRFRYVHLGGTDDLTPVVVAAAHPSAEVEAWSHRSEHIETLRRARDAIGLTNLTIDERPGGPHVATAPADVVVVSELLHRVDDEMRRCVSAIVEQCVRPGGIACVSYNTTVGWGEIEPVVRLMRYVSSRPYVDDRETIPAVRDLLVELRSGGARYLTDRPLVAEWLDALELLEDERVSELLADEFRPLSHAQALELVGTRAHYIGSAALLDDLGDDVPEGLRAWIDDAPTSVLRETYRDLAVRRRKRHDLFRVGSAPLDQHQRDLILRNLRFAMMDGTSGNWGELTGTELADKCWRGVRQSMESTEIHPLADGTDDAAQNTTIELGGTTPSGELIVLPSIGGAALDGGLR